MLEDEEDVVEENVDLARLGGLRLRTCSFLHILVDSEEILGLLSLVLMTFLVGSNESST